MHNLDSQPYIFNNKFINIIDIVDYFYYNAGMHCTIYTFSFNSWHS